MNDEWKLRSLIVEIGRAMAARGHIVATEGNISVRLGRDRVLATPSGFAKGDLKPFDLVVTDLEGRKVLGENKPTSELAMHLAIYRVRQDARAVIHAHPPVATGFSCAGIALDEPLTAEAVIGIGRVPIAPYATTGTPEMGHSLAGLIKEADAVLLANHGAVVLGPDLRSAFHRLEMVESVAKVALVARLLGHRNPLDPAEVERLLRRQRGYGA